MKVSYASAMEICFDTTDKFNPDGVMLNNSGKTQSHTPKRKGPFSKSNS